MTQLLKLKNSSVSGKVPLTTDLAFGELAINYADGKLYFKKSDGTTIDYFKSGGVTSFNGNTGDITLSSSDITNALGYTPLDGITYYGIVSVLGYTPLSSISSSDVTNALGYTPISSISYNDVTNALGYTPLSGVSYSDVTNALGYTPYFAVPGDTVLTDNSIANYAIPIPSNNTAPWVDGALLFKDGSGASWAANAITYDKINNGLNAGALTFVNIGGLFIGQSPTPTLTFNTNTVLHSGNVSSYAMTSSGGSLTGNLAVNTTLYSWGTQYKVLQVGPTTSLVDSASVGNNYTNLQNNYTVNGGGSPIYQTSAPASFYSQYNGTHNWYSAPTGSAGSIVIFSSANMTLSADGALNTVGAITQNGSQVLHAGNYTTYIAKRVVVLTDATSITINTSTTDLARQTNTQALGTLTFNAPTGSPVDGQQIIVRITSTNAHSISWNSIFRGSTDLALPTALSGSSKEDYFGFIYDAISTKWDLIAKNFGF